jgi:hypothetical protein
MNTQYDKTIFNKEHGSNVKIPRDLFKNVVININDLLSINHKYMGGGMSQNQFAIPILEYYIDTHRFEYIVEIGTQKGALSTYFANMAAITERFYFDTFELNPYVDYYSRTNEGCGHWLDKISKISPFVNSYHGNSFSREVIEHIKLNVSDKKTFIFCDGGDKIKEFWIYSEIIKPGDCIAVHDWGTELIMDSIQIPIQKNNMIVDEPFATSFTSFKTQIMPFIKK